MLWPGSQSIPGEEGETVNAKRIPIIAHPVSPKGKAMVTEQLLLGNMVMITTV